MNDTRFKGVSECGDFNEALSNAIQTAKETLKRDYVKWELSNVSGSDGGFKLENIIEISITVK